MAPKAQKAKQIQKETVLDISSGDGPVSKQMAAQLMSVTAAPMLRFVHDGNHWREFKIKYQEYLLQLSTNEAPKEMRQCVTPSAFQGLVSLVGLHPSIQLTREEDLTDEILKTMMEDFHQPKTKAQLQIKLEQIIMKGEKVQHCLEYNTRWRLALTQSKNEVHYEEASNVKTYILGLKPEALQKQVKKENPNTLEKAMQVALVTSQKMSNAKIEVEEFYGTNKKRPANVNSELDEKNNLKNKKPNNGKKHENEQNKAERCTCGSKTHKPKDCKIVCYGCGKLGHKQPQCKEGRVQEPKKRKVNFSNDAEKADPDDEGTPNIATNPVEAKHQDMAPTVCSYCADDGHTRKDCEILKKVIALRKSSNWKPHQKK